MADCEILYIVERHKDRYYITGFTERETAEQFGVRHLTVIVVPFLINGPDQGKWIVHDRSAKQWAKGKPDCKSPSYNLFGGHCTADLARPELIGAEIPMEICLDAARRELDEELLFEGKGKPLEVWEKGAKTEQVLDSAPYQADDLIPLGFASYEDKDNVEFSYFFALPVSGTDVGGLIAADDYLKDGVKHNVFLPIKIVSESDLQVMLQTEPRVEICDAITRLWLEENKAVRSKLHETIAACISEE
jgi:hypothetical protein